MITKEDIEKLLDTLKVNNAPEPKEVFFNPNHIKQGLKCGLLGVKEVYVTYGNLWVIDTITQRRAIAKDYREV
ncbi:MAG: hypothetical protein GY793_01915 [Proteobacteria bacterium]|nr:hypothetical protein [Pseudomonadota bacterium]